jgi:hypothetical protein
MIFCLEPGLAGQKSLSLEKRVKFDTKVGNLRMRKIAFGWSISEEIFRLNFLLSPSKTVTRRNKFFIFGHCGQKTQGFAAKFH